MFYNLLVGILWNNIPTSLLHIFYFILLHGFATRMKLADRWYRGVGPKLSKNFYSPLLTSTIFSQIFDRTIRQYNQTFKIPQFNLTDTAFVNDLDRSIVDLYNCVFTMTVLKIFEGFYSKIKQFKNKSKLSHVAVL